MPANISGVEKENPYKKFPVLTPYLQRVYFTLKTIIKKVKLKSIFDITCLGREHTTKHNNISVDQPPAVDRNRS